MRNGSETSRSPLFGGEETAAGRVRAELFGGGLFGGGENLPEPFGGESPGDEPRKEEAT